MIIVFFLVKLSVKEDKNNLYQHIKHDKGPVLYWSYNFVIF